MTNFGLFLRTLSVASPSIVEIRRYRFCILIFLGMVFWALPSQAIQPDWRLDPVTGNAVGQLTAWDGSSSALSQDNYALYYHQPNQTGDGQFLVYRHTECGCNANGCGTSSASVAYHLYDLESGSDVQLTATGLANAAVVHGPHLYVAVRGTPSGDYQYIERIDLENLTTACLTPLPVGQELEGSLTVNADGSALIYQTRPKSEESPESGTWVHFFDPSPSSVCPTVFSDTLLHPFDEGVEHIQFSPTNPAVFTFIDGGQSDLAKLGIGTVTASSSTWNPLSSTDSYFDSFYGFPHPFWDANGLLWTDAIGPSSSTSLSEAFVRLEVDEASGWVTNHGVVSMVDADWHHHQGGGRSVLG